MTVALPVLSRAQAAAWHVLFDLAERVPRGWVLVGGQMVHLLCAEHEVDPYRSTPDADAVVDARRVPQIFTTVTSALQDLGLEVDHETDGGKDLRWRKGEASIDVLIPQNLGRAADVKSAAGRPGLETPAADHVLRRSELIEVEVDGRTGNVSRPTLVGALVAKAGAYSIPAGNGRDRHIDDLCLLASMLTARDLRAAELSKGEKKYLRPAVEKALNFHRLDEIGGGRDGLTRLAKLLN